jgi:hypothetical protein
MAGARGSILRFRQQLPDDLVYIEEEEEGIDNLSDIYDVLSPVQVNVRPNTATRLLDEAELLGNASLEVENDIKKYEGSRSSNSWKGSGNCDLIQREMIHQHAQRKQHIISSVSQSGKHLFPHLAWQSHSIDLDSSRLDDFDQSVSNGSRELQRSFRTRSPGRAPQRPRSSQAYRAQKQLEGRKRALENREQQHSGLNLNVDFQSKTPAHRHRSSSSSSSRNSDSNRNSPVGGHFHTSPPSIPPSTPVGSIAFARYLTGQLPRARYD